MLYMWVQKAIYGMLKSVSLFYKKLRQDLENNGFQVNPYDPCVANKQINGHQMTVVWHMDDLKILHKNLKEISKLTKYLSKIYSDIKISQGRVHEYLEMTLDCTKKGKCRCP